MVRGTAQVIVVGAGVIGCAVAHELARRGARVRVVDRRDVGQGATQASAGVLAPYITAHEGSALLDLGARSLSLYDEFVSRTVEDSGSTVQYVRRGTIELGFDEIQVSRLERAAGAYRGLGAIAECVDRKAALDLEPQLSGQVQAALVVAQHGFVGASDLTIALRRAAGAHGVTFMPATTVTRLSSNGGGVQVETANEVLSSDVVILAAGSWSGQVGAESEGQIPLKPVRGQLLQLEWPTSPLKRVVWTDACYLVPWTDGSVLVGATVEDVGFDERATVAGVQELIEMTCGLVPNVRKAWLQKVRVGLRPGTPDNLPVVGPSERLPGLFYATGHFRNGVLLAPLTAQLAADFVLDGVRDSAFEIMSPSRFHTE